MYGALASDVADASAGSGARRHGLRYLDSEGRAVARFALSRLLLIASCLSHISVYRISDGGVTSYFWPRPEICQACLLTGRFDQSPAGQTESLGTFII